MAKAPKKADTTIDTAPDSGAAVEAVDTVETSPEPEIEEQPVGEQVVETIDFAGSAVPVDSLFVTAINRNIELDYNGVPTVFMFKADEPRQLPPPVIMQALGMGVQVAG